MKRKELLNSNEYWISKIQIDLYNIIEDYIAKNKITKTQLAEQLGVTKGYVSQILNGDFDHKVSKLVELSLAVGKIPVLTFEDIGQHCEDDELNITHIPFNERPIIKLDLNHLSKITHDTEKDESAKNNQYT
jgi:transcriptional regulator with XRE-family HTH domain